mgnify:CR=1 FL=1
MLHWFTIIIGIFLLSLSISNPLYKLTTKSIFKFNLIINILIRFFLLFIGILLIFLGLYFESIV